MASLPRSTSNVELGRLLGLDHSTVSRMRACRRYGSNETLGRIAELNGVPISSVILAVKNARAGQPKSWLKFLNDIRPPEPTSEKKGA